MIKFEDVKSLTYNHTKLWVPYDTNKRAKGYYFYMLNSPLESIAGILNDTTEMISNAGSIYKAYFYDYEKLPRCIQSKKVVNSGLKMAGAKKQYLQNCALIREQCNGIKAPLRIDTLAGKNFIYDLNPMTDLYDKQSKLKNLTIVNKLKTYFNTLNFDLPASTLYCKKCFFKKKCYYTKWKQYFNILKNKLGNYEKNINY